MDVSIGEATHQCRARLAGPFLRAIPRWHVIMSIIRMAIATHANAMYDVSLSPLYIQNGIQRKAKGGIKSLNKCCWRRNVPIRADIKNKPKLEHKDVSIWHDEDVSTREPKETVE